MKRFWKEVTTEQVEGGWRVLLDGRPLRTQGGGAQVVPTAAMAEALAEEWRAQGEDVNPCAFVLRDLADLAIDQVQPDRAGAIARLLPYAETDTLCYRADPDEPLYRRQLALWEPLLASAEARHAFKLERVSGVLHRPQPAAAMARIREVLESLDDFSLAAVMTLAPLAASLTIGLTALDAGQDITALFDASNCEQDWQAELWGWEAEAQVNRASRLAAFENAATFVRLAHTGG
jgi:chaperone required for assembly of F1-ATPase